MFSVILDGLVKILGPIATIGKDQREQKDTALRAISTALMETKLYYGKFGGPLGRQRDLDRESMLAKYWAAAAIPIRHFDPELAAICQNKADYWVNPLEYSDDDIAKLGIRLEALSDAYQKMLKPRFGSLRSKMEQSDRSKTGLDK